MATAVTATPTLRLVLGSNGNNDKYSYTEAGFQAVAVGNVVSLNVLSNDGKSATLWSLDDGNGAVTLLDTDLLTQDIVGIGADSAATRVNGTLLAMGDMIRIGATGQVELDVSRALASLGIASVDGLTADDTIQEEFVYSFRLSGGTTLYQQRVALEIKGQNDAATIGGAIAASTSEDTSAPLAGVLTVSDVDRGEAGLRAESGMTQNGSFTVAADGTWTFALDTASVQYLGAGDTVVDHFTVKSLDGTASQKVAVAITGVNDAASFSGALGATAGEDQGTVVFGAGTTTPVTATLSGTVLVADADRAESQLRAGSGASLYGSYQVTTAGDWYYTLDNARVQFLSDGASATDSFTVTSLDGTTQAITITILGANDGDGTLTATDAGEVTEDGPLTATGTIATTGGLQVQLGETAGSYGSFTVTSAEWRYTTGNGAAVQALAAGETLSETFTVRSLDGTASQAVSITIAGTNDAVAIGAADDAGLVVEDGSQTAGGSIAFADVDVSDTHTVSVTGKGAYGALSVGPAEGGSVAWSYTLDNAAAQALGAQDTATESFIVLIDDAEGGAASQAVTVTVQGANDRVVIGPADDAGAVTEDGQQTANGLVAFTDADAGDAHTVSILGTGGYGGLSVGAPSGGSVAWTYTLDNGAAQALGAKDTATETFAVAIDDGNGGVASQAVTITVQGTNDAPVILSAPPAEADSKGGAPVPVVVEDAVPDTGGVIAFTDLDATDTHTASASGTGAYGAFSVGTPAGGSVAWTYTLDDDAAQSLGATDTATEIFTVTIDDGNGGTASRAITITVHGTNDAVVIGAADATGTVQEDAAPGATGTVTFTDLDASDSHVAGVAGAGAYGALSVGAAEGGSVAWSYTLDNGAAQALGAKDTATETFTVAIDDGNGGVASQAITVTVQGTNDAPVILPAPPAEADSKGGAPVPVVVEDALPDTGGMIAFTDVDANDTHTASASGTGAYGALSVGTPAGGSVAWTYTLDNEAAQALGAQDTATEAFTVAIDDGHGGVATQAVTITVYGTNDAPVILSAPQAEADSKGGVPVPVVVEDAAPEAGGAIAFSDADANDTHTASASDTGVYGTLSVGAPAGGTVSWTYTLDDDTAQGLGAGDTVRESFLVTIDDGNGGTASQAVAVIVRGSNDEVLIGAADAAGLVEEDGDQTAAGMIAFTDADIGDAHTVSVAGQGAYGALSAGVAAGGSAAWSYTLDNAAAQALGANESTTETFTLTIDDGQGSTATQTITITIQGTNDAPEDASEGVTLQEDGSVSGTLLGNASDAEGDALRVGGFVFGTTSYIVAKGTSTEATLAGVGSLTIGSDGAYSFVPAADYNGTVPAVTYTVLDDAGGSDSSDLAITVAAVNDAPVANPDGYTTNEDTPLVVAAPGVLGNDTDTDGNPLSALLGGGAANGTVALNADGGFTYTPFANFNGKDSFTYRASDGQDSSATTIVDLTVLAVNDVPTLVVTTSGSVTEDGPLTTTGSIVVTDADGVAESQAFLVGTTATAYGSYKVDAGAWTYTTNNGTAVQALPAGQTLTDTFTVFSQDKTASQVVTVTINGANDAPSISGPNTGGVSENNVAPTSIVSGTVAVSDPDVGESGVVAQQGAIGTYGTFAIASDGRWTYTLDNTDADTNALRAGAVGRELFRVDSLDGSAFSAVVVTVTGTNDVPTISGQVTGTITAVNGGSNTGKVSGQATISDPDTGESLFASLVGIVGKYGSIFSNNSGAWSYTLVNSDPDTIALPGGATGTDTFTLKSADGTASQVVTISVIGANGTATIGGTRTATLVESNTSATTTATGTLVVTDPEPGENAVIPRTDVAGKYGSFSVAANGQWTYVLDNTDSDTDALIASSMVFEAFTVTSVDGSATQTVAMTITGANDVPIIGGTFAITMAESNTTSFSTASGTFTIIDPDAGQAQFVAQNSMPGTYGSFTLMTDGQWFYHISHLSPAVNALRQNATAIETFTVQSQDRLTSPAFVVTLVGLNDPASIGGTLAGTVSESNTAATSTVTGTLTVTDPDTGENQVTAQSNVAGKYGSFSVTSAGAWTYVLDNADPDTNALSAGASATETFTVASIDGTAVQAVKITVTGTNDAPTAANDSASGNEDTVITGSVLANDTDPDTGTTLSAVLATGPTNGTLVLNANGSFTYTPNSNFNGSDSFTYRASDGTAVSATATVALTVVPVNDAPTGIVFNPRTVETPYITETFSYLGNFAAAGDPDGPGAAGYGWSMVSGPAMSYVFTDGKLSVYQNFTSGPMVVRLTDGAHSLTATFTVTVGGPDRDGDINFRFGGNSSGNDIVAGGEGNDFLAAGDGTNYLLGGNGSDSLLGGANTDFLYGLAEFDLLEGQGGNDYVVGGGGNDSLVGGAGNDSFVYLAVADSPWSTVPSIDSIYDFAAGDLLDLSAFQFASTGVLRTVRTGVAYDQPAAVANFYGTSEADRNAVAVSALSGGARRVFVDLNGNRNLDTGDLMINLANGYQIGSTDIRW